MSILSKWVKPADLRVGGGLDTADRTLVISGYYRCSRTPFNGAGLDLLWHEGGFMAPRRIVLSLVVAALFAAACAGNDEGITFQEPIGAPDSSTYSSDDGPGADSGADAVTPPAIIKGAELEMDVASNKLGSAAQEVIDVATSPEVGGYLVRALVDHETGEGRASIEMKVPATRFEDVVVELGSIADLTRQFVEGQDLTGDYAHARNQIFLTERRVKSLLRDIDNTDDPGTVFELRRDLAAARSSLENAEADQRVVTAQTTYSGISVGLNGTPAPAPSKPALERALDTAKEITLTIASGIVLALGVVLPIGALLAALYAVAVLIRKRVRLRLEG